MTISVEEFVDQLLTQEALDEPSDKVKPDELTLQLPPWYDKKKYDQARRFMLDHFFFYNVALVLGLLPVFAVPSILSVLVGTRRSASPYTAYKRYVSTLLHVQSWFEHELTPNSLAWKSLHTVRSRHLRTGLASKKTGGEYVSQRDIALTQFGFIGITMLKPDKLGIRQLREGDWEAYNHFWKVLGYMIGLEDRYNICRDTPEETRQVCQLLQDRVFTPCLENVPEYFEHMTRAMLNGLWCVTTIIDEDAIIYYMRYLTDVPGYIYTESDRLAFQNKLKEKLKGKSLYEGVDSRSLMSRCYVDGLPDRPPRMLYLKNYDKIENIPEYKDMSFWSRFILALLSIMVSFFQTTLGRFLLNLYLRWNFFLTEYFPYLAFVRWGIKTSLVNMFIEDPKDNTTVKKNAEYYKKPKRPWYLSWLSMF